MGMSTHAVVEQCAGCEHLDTEKQVGGTGHCYMFREPITNCSQYKESPASPAGSLADNLETALHAHQIQYKKVMQLIDSGALICGLTVELNVPHKGWCTVDQHGRAVWSK
ncbi:MAG: hypothetical protein ABW134_11685 [Candidatus Thiodiazotropha endolucinida]